MGQAQLTVELITIIAITLSLSRLIDAALLAIGFAAWIGCAGLWTGIGCQDLAPIHRFQSPRQIKRRGARADQKENA
jgi:hypothetical protein